jgi:hypothetical protein
MPPQCIGRKGPRNLKVQDLLAMLQRHAVHSWTRSPSRLLSNYCYQRPRVELHATSQARPDLQRLVAGPCRTADLPIFSRSLAVRGQLEVAI